MYESQTKQKKNCIKAQLASSCIFFFFSSLECTKIQVIKKVKQNFTIQ